MEAATASATAVSTGLRRHGSGKTPEPDAVAGSKAGSVLPASHEGESKRLEPCLAEQGVDIEEVPTHPSYVAALLGQVCFFQLHRS